MMSPDELDSGAVAATDEVASPRTYAVGYAKPPIHSRFQPGRSGNPKGRLKARRSLKAVVEAALYEKVSVQTSGGVRKISKIDALVRKLLNDALKGDVKAIQQVVRLAKDAGLTEEVEAIETAMTDLDEADQRIYDRYFRPHEDVDCGGPDQS